MKVYDQAKLNALADEVEALPDKSVIPAILSDYSTVRRICRKLEKQ